MPEILTLALPRVLLIPRKLNSLYRAVCLLGKLSGSGDKELLISTYFDSLFLMSNTKGKVV